MARFCRIPDDCLHERFHPVAARYAMAAQAERDSASAGRWHRSRAHDDRARRSAAAAISAGGRHDRRPARWRGLPLQRYRRCRAGARASGDEHPLDIAASWDGPDDQFLPDSAAPDRSRWIEPLHDADGGRIGEMRVRLRDDQSLDVSAEPLLHVCATIAELVFQRDAAVARLAQGRELYRSLLDNHPDAVLHVDAEAHPECECRCSSAVRPRRRSAAGRGIRVAVRRGDAVGARAAAAVGPARPRAVDGSTGVAIRRCAHARTRAHPRASARRRAPSRSVRHRARRDTSARIQRALRRTYEQSLSRRDQLLELSAVAIDSAAIDSVNGLALQLARSMILVAHAQFVRLNRVPRRRNRPACARRSSC